MKKVMVIMLMLLMHTAYSMKQKNRIFLITNTQKRKLGMDYSFCYTISQLTSPKAKEIKSGGASAKPYHEDSREELVEKTCQTIKTCINEQHASHEILVIADLVGIEKTVVASKLNATLLNTATSKKIIELYLITKDKR